MRSFRLLRACGLQIPPFAPTSRRGWLCPSCQHGVSPIRRLSSSQSSSGKPYYVTTPIFYVNASPHIGHLYSMVLADVLKRWQVVKENRAILCTGTDEHGMKVQRAAAREGLPPAQFCYANAEKFKELAAAASIDNDFFIRTTDPAHVEAVQYFWNQLKERGYIYESTHEGWYCVSDECFYPESLVEKRFMPATGKTVMASVETGNEVEWTQEKNYHFRMTALKDRLLDFYGANPKWVMPLERMNEVVQWVEKNLEDLSISRPVSRLDWGVRVPGDPTQTIYVWVDALINYLTVAGFPGWEPGHEHDGGWPPDVQVIGKDIVRFHGVYWPALLLALDLPLPKRLLSHAHWTLGEKKMSKSTGNVVNPFFAMSRWGVDVMRYYLIRDGGISRDSDYGNERIATTYKKDLQGGVGNLLSRLARSKSWKLSEAVRTASTWSEEGRPIELTSYKNTTRLKALLERLPDEFSEHMDRLDPVQATRCAINAIYEVNAYLSDTEPWKISGKGGQGKQGKLLVNWIVYNATEALRISSILLQPVMPSKMAELLDALGVDAERRSFRFARLGSDFTYGAPIKKIGTAPWEALFPPPASEN